MNILTANNVASLTACLSMATGTLNFIAPQVHIKGANAPDGPRNVYLVQLTGMMTASFGCLIFFQVVVPKPFHEAFAISMIPWSISGVRDMIERPDLTIGLDRNATLRRLILSCIAAYFGFSNNQYTMIVARIVAFICSLAGTVLAVNAESFPSRWSKKKDLKDEPILPLTLRSIGFTLLSFGVYIICSMDDIGPVRAVGCAFIPMIINMALVMKGPNPKGTSLSQSTHAGWLSLCFFIAGGTLLL